MEFELIVVVVMARVTKNNISVSASIRFGGQSKLRVQQHSKLYNDHNEIANSDPPPHQISRAYRRYPQE